MKTVVRSCFGPNICICCWLLSNTQTISILNCMIVLVSRFFQMCRFFFIIPSYCLFFISLYPSCFSFLCFFSFAVSIFSRIYSFEMFSMQLRCFYLKSSWSVILYLSLLFVALSLLLLLSSIPALYDNRLILPQHCTLAKGDNFKYHEFYCFFSSYPRIYRHHWC